MEDMHLIGLKIPVSRVRLTVWAPRNKDKIDAAGFVPSPPCTLNLAGRVPAGCQRLCPRCGEVCEGTRNRCNACRSKQAQLVRAGDLARHRAQERVRNKRHRALYPERVRAQDLAAKRKKAGYPTSQSAVWDMLSKQSGGCAICGTADPGGGKSWSVDHDHGSGYIRGVLCRTCNVGLGHFKDSLELLEAARAYLVAAREREAALQRKIEAFRAHYSSRRPS